MKDNKYYGAIRSYTQRALYYLFRAPRRRLLNIILLCIKNYYFKIYRKTCLRRSARAYWHIITIIVIVAGINNIILLLLLYNRGPYGSSVCLYFIVIPNRIYMVYIYNIYIIL